MAFVEEFMDRLVARNPSEQEFHQAVREVVTTIESVVDSTPRYHQLRILERMVEPERVIMFRVPWMDDQGEVRVHRGFRVEMNNAIGPFKGGLRFHADVTLGVLKFLAFEQLFKNALTTLPLGAAKGGADFDPKGKSDGEVMRFCHAFMNELYRHLGSQTDVPAGDMGVGRREIGFLFGQYKKLTNEFSGALTGKGISWGGSFIRPESTGFGSAYFAEEMLASQGEGLEGKTVAVSGAGNVAQYTVQKVNELGGKVVTLSDTSGTVVDHGGIDDEKLRWVMELKNIRRGDLRGYVDEFSSAQFISGGKPWSVACDVAFPSAVQNELDERDAETLVSNRCRCVCEGANMPCTPAAARVFRQARILFAPGKAANAGGVATSGLEMAQNASFQSWTREEVDARLKSIMADIHEICAEFGRTDDFVDYVRGANVAAFVKVADAMVEQGVV